MIGLLACQSRPLPVKRTVLDTVNHHCGPDIRYGQAGSAYSEGGERQVQTVVVLSVPGGPSVDVTKRCTDERVVAGTLGVVRVLRSRRSRCSLVNNNRKRKEAAGERGRDREGERGGGRVAELIHYC